MSIIVDAHTRVLVQGITGEAAQHHTRLMLDYGTKIVAGVRPGAGGTSVGEVEVFNTVSEAVIRENANTSILFVPARVMKNAAFEAIDAGIRTMVMVSEHVPLHDTMEIVTKAEDAGVTVVGPNTPGLISPGGKCKVGFVPSRYYKTGSVGVASRSGTLTYEIVSRLTKANIGQSSCVGIGGDPVVGTPFSHILQLFENDAETRLILLIGEIGGSMEEDAAELVAKGLVTKPVIAYLAGRTAPEDKKMGHAGAIIARGRGTIKSKLNAFMSAGIPVAKVPEEVVPLIKELMNL